MSTTSAEGLPLIGAVLAPRCGDATDPFDAVAKRLVARGLRLAGVRQINEPCENANRCHMKLEDLSDGSVILISEDRGPEARGCRLDRGALTEASERVAAAIRRGVDLVIVNKFGKAESEGGGMRDVIALAAGSGTPVLICANDEHHPNLMGFAGDLAVALPLSEPDIDHWLDAVLTAAAKPCLVEA